METHGIAKSRSVTIAIERLYCMASIWPMHGPTLLFTAQPSTLLEVCQCQAQIHPC